MYKIKLLPATTILILLLSFLLSDAYALDVVASIKDIKGQIEIERSNNRLAARNGLILYDKDTVVTGENSKATIVFRDGSTIRLFAKTRFLIEKSVEARKGARRFLHNFILKLGSFWGKFSKKYQNTTIRTPTATAGIKGTIVSMTQRNNRLSVSLTSGAITLQNDNETVNLKPGQIVRNITSRDPIGEKIENLPYELVFKADEAEIKIPESGNEVEVYFTLQMVEKSIRKNASRSGPVYISHEFDNIRFEPNIRLNSRGYARIKATVTPFQERDSFRETVDITAVMDSEHFIDVNAGQTNVIFIQKGRKSKTLKIDVHSDNIE